MLRRTPLWAAHQRLGARMTAFGGWDMPVQYTGIAAEHLAVRSAAGVFDISHMGKVRVRGPGAGAFLNYMLTCDVGRLDPGQGRYGMLCNERGGVVDDLYVYRLGGEEYLLIVNAARTAADWDWLQTHVDAAPTPDGFQLDDASAELAAVAVQGPRVTAFIEAVLPGGSIGGALAARLTDLKKNQVAGFVFRGTSVLAARTGYTGEDGFELLVEAGLVESLWEALLEAGRPHGLRPAGLGARDTLRTEMGYPLYGHELSETLTPLEAGITFCVVWDKGEFLGRDALCRQKAAGLTRRVAWFRQTTPAPPPRPGYTLWSPAPEAQPVGPVLSGTASPSLGVGIGSALPPAELVMPGTALEVEIRGRQYPVVVAERPLYRRP